MFSHDLLGVAINRLRITALGKGTMVVVVEGGYQRQNTCTMKGEQRATGVGDPAGGRRIQSRRINKKYRHDIMNSIMLYTNFKSISVI